MDYTGQTILLVEDSDDDVFIFRRTAKIAGIANPIQVVCEGEEALAYLGGTGPYADRKAHPVPFLLFLDLKLPQLSGLDILQWIREQPQLSEVSVVVLTSSAEERDIVRAYQLGARSYLVKPPTGASLIEVLQAIQTSASVRERLRITGAKTG
ncbi:MAG: response regulator [Akkermansiaceae bacterium]|nr:response regulator [Verrucomicrobiales bacterium]